MPDDKVHAVLGYPSVFEDAARRFAGEAERAAKRWNEERLEAFREAEAEFTAAAILLAVGAVEAAIGEFVWKAKEKLGKEQAKKFEQKLGDISNPHDKCKAIANERNQRAKFGEQEGISDFKCVYQLRNAIVHYKRVGLDRGDWPPEVGATCKEVLNRVYDIAEYDWASVALKHEFATWAVETVRMYLQRWEEAVWPDDTEDATG